MTLTQPEFDAIMEDETKTISANIDWEGNPNSQTLKFRVDIDSSQGHPIFVDGWCNFSSGKLSFSIIHRSVGRIYGLDLGADHQNPDGEYVGEKHKNHWVPGSRDKWAYVPEDITETWEHPVETWRQFCEEAHIDHQGEMQAPSIQRAWII